MSWPHRPGRDAAYHIMAFPGPWIAQQGVQLPVIAPPQLISCQSWKICHMVHIPLPFHSEIYVSIQEDLLLTKGHFKNILLFCFLIQTGGKETRSMEKGSGVKAESTQVSLNRTSVPRILIVKDADEITQEVLILTSEGHHHKSVFFLAVRAEETKLLGANRMKGGWKEDKEYHFLASSVQFSCSVVSNSLQPHEPQHTRPPCPSPASGVYPNSCPLSWWCHPTISSSVIPFSSCPQSFPASGSFQMKRSYLASYWLVKLFLKLTKGREMWVLYF